MINAKKAAIKTEKVQRKQFKHDFHLIKFGVKERIKHGEKQLEQYIDECYYTEDNVNIIVNYFTEKGYQVQIKEVPRVYSTRKKIIISW